MNFPGRGYSHVKTYGNALQNGLVSCKISINMGPIFNKKILNCGSDVLNWEILKIWCVFVAKSQEMGTCFFFKSINMGTYFRKNYPEHGYGSCVAGSTSPTNLYLSTPLN